MPEHHPHPLLFRVATRLLYWFCDPAQLPAIEGDLYELHQQWTRRHGRRKAQWLYLWNVITFFRPATIKKRHSPVSYNLSFMNRYHFRIALRHMLRHKLYTLINLSSLVIGMGCCVLIFLYVQHELAYDQHHTRKDRIYRLLERSEKLDVSSALLPGVARSFMLEEVASLEEVVRICAGMEDIVTYEEQTQEEGNFWFADPEILKVFDYSFLKGDSATALAEPSSVIVTESTARRYFGEQEAIGQVISYDHKVPLTVTAVIADIPETSHFTFDFLAPIANMEKLNAAALHQWDVQSMHYYCLLPEGTNTIPVQQQIKNTVLEHSTNINDQVLAEIEELGIYVYLEPLTDIHLYSASTQWDLARKGDITYVVGFSMIALLLLCIACFNFMNLTTANASQRAKEVGIKKTLGAVRTQLMGQFYLETLLFTLMAGGLSLLLAYLLLPYFNQLLDKQLTLSLGNVSLLMALGLMVGVVFLLAGSYPALYLSRLKLINSLKSIGTSQAVASWGSMIRLRHILVISQFGVAIALIISSFFVASQLRLMMEGKLGFDEEQLLVITNPWDDDRLSRLETFSREVLQNSYIAGISSAQNSPVGYPTNSRMFRVVDQPEEEALMSSRIAVSPDFLEVIGAEFVAGRNFTDSRSDSATAVVLNETAARRLGLDQPVGKFIWDNNLDYPQQVIGVVKDVQYASVHEETQPAVFYINATMSTNSIVVRTTPGDLPATVGFLQATWERLAPDWPFQYQFMDERLNKMYRAELQTQQLVRGFTLLTILVACLGLFGLATLTTERRTKEIGIRKVLGASVKQLVLLLSRDFIGWVVIAFVVACPLAYWAVRYWLQNFAERVPISWWVFVLAGGAALLIAWITVSYQSIRTARANPVDALRNE